MNEQTNTMNKYLSIILLVVVPAFNWAQSSVAHMNSQDVMAAMPSYNSAVKSLDSLQAATTLEVQTMIANYDEALKIYLEKQNELSPVLLQIEQEKLAKKEQAITDRQQSIQRELQAYSQELNFPILEKIQTAVNTVSDRNKYDYVFDISTVMVANGPDITQEVIKEVLILESMPVSIPPQEDIRAK